MRLLDYTIHKFTGGTIPEQNEQRILPATKAADAEMVRQLGDADPQLQAMFLFAASLAWHLFRKRFIITNIEDNYGTHAANPCRAIDTDVDEHGQYGGISPEEMEHIARIVDQTFRYDNDRPEFFCCVFGWRDKNGKHDNHAHWQTCWGARTTWLGIPQLGSPIALAGDPRYAGRLA